MGVARGREDSVLKSACTISLPGAQSGVVWSDPHSLYRYDCRIRASGGCTGAGRHSLSAFCTVRHLLIVVPVLAPVDLLPRRDCRERAGTTTDGPAGLATNARTLRLWDSPERSGIAAKCANDKVSGRRVLRKAGDRARRLARKSLGPGIAPDWCTRRNPEPPRF